MKRLLPRFCGHCCGGVTGSAVADSILAMTSPANSTNAAIRGYLQQTPLGEIQSLIHGPGVDWADDAQSVTKAYIMACLSEIVYLCVPGYALKNRDRYKIIPSEALSELNGDDASFGMADLCCYLVGLGVRFWARADLGLEVGVAATATHLGNYIFVTFRLPRFTVIAVRGTTPVLEDVLLDLDDRLVEIKGHRYHAGFYLESFKALPDLMLSVDHELPLYFTGHSLGGAVAGILPQLWAGKPRLMTPYTFASPRFGNDQAADPKRHPVYAYVRARDPIPHVPLEMSGFRSSGWPPTMVPPTDRWRSGVELLGLRPKAHSIEGYRMLLGDEALSRHFAPLVYFDELKKRLTSGDLRDLQDGMRWGPA